MTSRNRQGSPSRRSSADCRSFESSLDTNPCKTVCNIFWGNKLAIQPFTEGDDRILFPSLWPDVRTFVDLYKEGGLEVACCDIVKLLLASCSLKPLKELVQQGLISWDRSFQNSQFTLVHLVCALGCEPLVELILKDTPQNGLWTAKDSHNRTPVDVCLLADTRRLIKKHSSFWSRMPKVQTGLQLTVDVKRKMFELAASPDGLYELAILLQTYKVDVNEEKDEAGNLLLHIAVRGGLPCLPLLFLLVNQSNADVNKTNEEGVSPLCLACQCGEERVAEVLVCVFGAALNTSNGSIGWTPLHYCAHDNHPELIRMLLSRGADANSEDKNKCVPSFLAQRQGATECAQILAMHSRERASSLAKLALEGSLEVDSLFPSDICLVTSDGFTLLMKAVLGDQPDLVRALLNTPNCPMDFRQMRLPDLSDVEGSLSSVPHVADQPLKTAVTLAATNGFTDCLKILLDAGAHPAIEDSQRWLPLHYACVGGHLECVKAIVFHPQGKGLTGLNLAMSHARDKGRMDIVNILKDALKKRQKQIVAERLFDIATSGDKDELFRLLEDGDDVNPRNEASDWPLLIAAGYGHLEIVEMLQRQGGYVVRRHSYTGNTPLHTAARGGHLEVVRYLLTNFSLSPGGCVAMPSSAESKYFDVNEKNISGATPLELACQQGHMPVVRLLLDHGAVTTLPDSNSQLLGCPNFAGIQFLLESRRKQHLDELLHALVNKRPLKEFTRIWQGPSDFNLRDAHWDTVLMVAARYSKQEIIEFLLQSATHYTSDMRINWSSRPLPATPRQHRDGNPVEPAYGFSPRHTERPVQNIQPRCQSVDPITMRRRGYYGRPPGDSSTDELSMSGETIAAAANGGPVVTQGPCTQSGIVCLVNRDGRTALHRAVEGNQHKNIITLLLQADPNIANIQDKNGQTALHYACHANHAKCVKALLSCPRVIVDAEVKDKANNFAEYLCVNGRLKKMVMQYRLQQSSHSPHTKPSHFHPLPPVGATPFPSDYDEDERGLYSSANVLYQSTHRRTASDGESMRALVSTPHREYLPPQEQHARTEGQGQRPRRRHSRSRASPPHTGSSDEYQPSRRRLFPIPDAPPGASQPSPPASISSLRERMDNLRNPVHHAGSPESD